MAHYWGINMGLGKNPSSQAPNTQIGDSRVSSHKDQRSQPIALQECASKELTVSQLSFIGGVNEVTGGDFKMKSPSVVPFKFQHNGEEKGSLQPSTLPTPTGLRSDPSAVVLQASEWSTKGSELRTWFRDLKLPWGSY